VVRDGRLAGQTLSRLVQTWKTSLVGDARLADGRFPLLVKFLDAREPLSVQVHPAFADDCGPRPGEGVKHEAWYVVHADPDAKLYAGLKPGVDRSELAGAVNSPAILDLLQVWQPRIGQCFYLPAGTLHALGAGLVVVEIQTPSDTTYRVYDWGRTGLDGRPRQLHIEPALRNVRYDVTEQILCPSPTPATTAAGSGTCLVRCQRFRIDAIRARAGAFPLPAGRMRIWAILEGRGRLTGAQDECRFARGDVILIPAACGQLSVELQAETYRLEVTVADSGQQPDL